MESNGRKRLELGARLAACAEFVRDGKVPADIGTDHAYLPIRLVLDGKVPFAFASDIHEDPIRLAKNNIHRFGLNEKVIAFTCDGLEKIPPDMVDDIIVAGMGGDNIADILGGAKWLRNRRYRLILQPMSRASRLRAFLFGNGFEILAEKAVCEAERIYTVIYADYATEMTDYHDYDIYAGRLDGRDPFAAALLRKQAGILLSMAKGCASKGDWAEEARYIALSEKLLSASKGERVND